MDTELARTFLTVVSAGNFINAADRLHVTQSAVSARIHSLEQQLGCRLFVRNKAGATLTPEGRQFQKHATALVRTVEQAHHDVGIPKGFRAGLTIAARMALWPLLMEWLSTMQDTAPDISVRAELGFEDALMQGLVAGLIDIAAMYTPQSRPGLRVERLFIETLVLVSTDPDMAPEPGPGYVYIDWGPEFQARHSASFPDFPGPALTANIAWLGIQHILRNGGSGYFTKRLVKAELDAGTLYSVAGAPEFTLPAYMVYHADADADPFMVALDGIRKAAKTYESGWHPDPKSGRSAA